MNNKLLLQLYLALSLLVIWERSYALELLIDDEMRQQTGQSLFTAKYINGTGTASTGSAGVDFYRLGIDAEVALNLNVKKIQLGCGGVNGAGCDIDMDNVSLSGNAATNTARVQSDAVLTRPFIDFAIKNPNTLASREILGFRFGAENLLGLLTIGENNGTSNGINSMSGYLPVAATTGSAQTQAASFSNQLEGLVTTGSCRTNATRNLSCAGFRTNGGSLTIASQNVNFNVNAFTVNGRRLNSVTVLASSTIGSIPINAASGDLTAKVVSIRATDGTTYNNCLFGVVCGLNLSKVNMVTNLTNLNVDITLNEALGYIHNIPLNSPLSLSLQKENVLWPGSPSVSAIAQRGWWMTVNDAVDLGALNVADQVDISAVFPQVAADVSTYLRRRGNAVFLPITSAIGALFTGQVLLNVPDINLSSQTSTLTLNNLALGATQNVVPNCYGTLKFC
jgi:hypothetical protein